MQLLHATCQDTPGRHRVSVSERENLQALGHGRDLDLTALLALLEPPGEHFFFLGAIPIHLAS